MLAVWEDDPETAVTATQEAFPLLHAVHDRAGELLALSMAGVCLGFAGDRDGAVLAHERSIALSEQSGETFRKSFSLAGLGEQALAAGEHDRAAELFAQSLRIKTELGDRMGIAVGLDSLGRVAVAQGNGRRAALLLGAAQSVWDAIGMRETRNAFASASSTSDGIQRTRRLLGKREFRIEFRRGSALSEDQAIAYALDDDLVPDAARDSVGAVAADPPRDRGRRSRRPRALEPGDRGAAVHLGAHRSGTRGEHPAEAGIQLPLQDRRVGGTSSGPGRAAVVRRGLTWKDPLCRAGDWQRGSAWEGAGSEGSAVLLGAGVGLGLLVGGDPVAGEG